MFPFGSAHILWTGLPVTALQYYWPEQIAEHTNKLLPLVLFFVCFRGDKPWEELFTWVVMPLPLVKGICPERGLWGFTTQCSSLPR